MSYVSVLYGGGSSWSYPIRSARSSGREPYIGLGARILHDPHAPVGDRSLARPAAHSGGAPQYSMMMPRYPGDFFAVAWRARRLSYSSALTRWNGKSFTIVESPDSETTPIEAGSTLVSLVVRTNPRVAVMRGGVASSRTSSVQRPWGNEPGAELASGGAGTAPSPCRGAVLAAPLLSAT